MKAVRFHQHGGPDVLVQEEAPEPQLAPGEVLVRIRACALNRIDVWGRQWRPGAAMQIALLHGSRVIDHYTQDSGAEIGRPTNRRGGDVVIERVGESTGANAEVMRAAEV
jgi:NADPH:quinone reductase-like Zn-dependent oxidoreductase